MAKATQHLLSQVEVVGVAAIKVADGELFAFSRKKLDEIRAQMDEQEQDRVIMFVKTGPDIDETPEN